MVTAAFLVTIVCLAIAGYRGRGARHTEAYFLASRQLSSRLAGLSAGINALPVWLLVATVFAAYAWGFAAIWILGAAVVGQAVCWAFVAPRIREWSAGQRGTSLLQLLASEAGTRVRGIVVLSAVLILFTGYLVTLSAALPWLGAAVAAVLPVSPEAGMLAGVAVATVCALLGGSRGVAAVDGIRALIVLGVLVAIAILACNAAGGVSALRADLAAVPGGHVWTGEDAPILSLTFVLGTLMLGLTPLGQPQVANRFIACGTGALKPAVFVSLPWLLGVLGAALVTGWSARLLVTGDVDAAAVVPTLLAEVASPAAAGGLAILLVVATAVGLDSLLLVMAAVVSVDIRREHATWPLDWPKPAVVLAGALLAAVGLTLPSASGEQLLFGWTLLAAAFGPLTLVRLSGKRVRPGSILGSMWAGFSLSVLLHLLPDAPGDFLERTLPFVVALGIALSGGERRRDPDRADRTQAPASPGPAP